MIEVKTPGKKMPEKYTGKCFKCECVIECVQGDITYPDRPCAEGYVKCPTVGCGGEIIPKIKNQK